MRNRRWERGLRVRAQSSLGKTIENTLLLVTGGILGATAMYIFDQNSGRRRRALARDKAYHYLKELQRASLRKAEDLKNRLVGSVQEARSRMREARSEIDDSVLEERVRAQLGHVVAHPGALEVRVDHGRVTVSGPVLMGERRKIQHRLSKTRGVREADVQVTEYASKEGVPGLQGESRTEQRERRQMAL
jgi:gas vesicle protein